MRFFVLIETYWNVNFFVKPMLWTSRVGLNRNILECKCNCYQDFQRYIRVLIETYWNVNTPTEQAAVGEN